MASITDFMTNDHRACDDIFALAEESVANGKWPKAKTEFANFCAEIERHLVMEDRDGYLGLSETLMVLTQQHNMKEEQMLYHMMDQTFGAEATALLTRAGAAL